MSTYNLDPVALDAAIEAVKAEGKLMPKVVIAVDLFGILRIDELVTTVLLDLEPRQALGGGELAVEASLHELDDGDPPSVPRRPHGQADRGGRLSLPVAGVELYRSLSFRHSASPRHLEHA